MLRIYEIAILLIATLAVFSCGTGMRTVAMSDVCREPSDGAVKVEGYFRLPQVSDWIGDDHSSGQYRLLLVEKLDGGGSFITATVSATESHERNHIEALPTSYTYDDVRINTDSGRTVSAGERLTVTGRVLKDSSPCILRIERIDTPPL
jgi:hypothetical protein